MAADVAHRRGWQIFEVVVGIPVLIGIVLHVVRPLAFPSGFLTPVLIPVGVALILAGAIVVVLARRQFARYGQPTDPGRPTSRIITTGVFSISRNPLYLGGIWIVAGGAFAFNLAWVAVLLIPALAACHYVLIIPEERYLAARFGEEYQTYAASVHRWLGRA